MTLCSVMKPMTRRDDGWCGQHPDVVQIGNQAFIFYFVHPERTGQQSFSFNDYMPIEYKRTSLQIAELDLEDSVLTCDRDRYHEQDD